MPILSKIQKNLGEMKEVDALAEWADKLIEGEGGPEASEEPTSDDMGNDTFGDEDGEDAPEDDLTEEESIKSNNPVGIPEGEDGTPKSHQAQTTLKHLKKASYGDKADAANIKSGIAGFRDRIDMLQRAKDEGNLKDEEVEEGFIGNMVNKAKGMFNKPATAPAACSTCSWRKLRFRLSAASTPPKQQCVHPRERHRGSCRS
jgi:hypothetical protein